MRLVLAALVVILVPSCQRVMKGWERSNPMETVIYVDAGSTVTSPEGGRVRLDGNAVLIPLSAFDVITETYAKALDVIRASEDMERVDPSPGGVGHVM